jgi:hypothetical protein
MLKTISAFITTSLLSFCITLLFFCPADTQAAPKLTAEKIGLETDLVLSFWFDNNPPTTNNKKFFKDTAEAIRIFESNNSKLESSGIKYGISTVDTQHSLRVLDAMISKNRIPDDFFYDLEKAQLLLATKMLFNQCRVLKNCSDREAKDQANSLLKFAKKKTSEGRILTKKRAVDANNDLALSLIVGGVAAAYVGGITEILKGGSSHSSTGSDDDYDKCDLKNDRCFEVVDKSNNDSPIVLCKKGINTGKKYCLSYSESSGKYATGCGISDIAAHHYTLKEAGNRSCWGNWLNN